MLAILLAVGARGLITAANDSTVRSTNDDHIIETEVVRLDGEPLFRVRGMVGYSAEERADTISKRLEDVAESVDILPNALTLEELPDRTNIMAGDQFLVSIFDSDAGTEKVPRSVMASRARLNVVRAIEKYREDRKASVLLRRTGIALVATLVFLFVLLGFQKIFGGIIKMAERHVKTRVEELETRSSKAVEARPLWATVMGVLGILRTIVLIVIFYFYLNLILGLYPWTRPLATHLFEIFISPLRTLFRGFINSVPDFAFLSILYFVVRYLLKVTRLFFMGIDNGTITINEFEQDWAWPTYRIVRILIICFSLVVAYPYIPGSNSDAFKGVSLFVGVLFSLGSTSFISNMIAGIALTYRRAFKVGDIIKVDNMMGLVTEMRIQATHLRTIHNEAVIIPNTLIVNSNITNHSILAKKDGIGLHTTVRIGYQTPWRQVEAMLLIAADRTAGLRNDKKAFVRQLSLDEFGVLYELTAYCDQPLKMIWLYSDLHKNILDVFNEYGVQIMTPAYEGDPEAPKVVGKDKMFAAPAKKDTPNAAPSQQS